MVTVLDPTENISDHHDLESATEKERTEEQIPQTAYLDGLRGLAALVVYFSHNVAWWYGLDPAFENGFGYHGEYMFATLPFVRTIFTGGSAAVAVFFVLSGYVLSLSPLRMLKQGKARETRLYLLTATIRRPFRLFLPVAILSLIFAVVMHLPFGLAPYLVWPKPEQTIFAEFLKWLREMGRMMNIFIPHNISTPWFPYNPPVWTMAAELEGSLSLYGILAASASASSRQRLGLLIFVGLSLLLLGQWEVAAFLLGATMATMDTEKILLFQHGLAKYSFIVNHIILFFGWYLLGQPAGGKDSEKSSATPGWYYFTLLTPPQYFHNEFWRFWTVIGATMLLYAITNISWMQDSIHRPAFRYLGKVSFSFYLVHIPIAWTIGDRIARAFGKFRFDFTTPFDNILPIPDYGPIGISTGFLIWQAFVLPINLYVASIVTKKIDDPSVNFGRWIASMVWRSGYI